VANEEPKGRPLWQRWNDYGIGLLRKPRKSQLRQAEEAFTQVEALGRGDGALNLARVYVAEGQLDEAALALRRAGTGENPAYPWTIAWFSALVDKQNGYLDQAITELDNVVDTRFTEARKRGFDFSEDYRALNELGETLFERARQQRGESRKPVRDKLLQAAVARFQAVLRIDPENVTAHYDLAQIYQTLGDTAQALAQRQLHARYKADDNAMDYAVAEHRLTHPAADHAAEPVVIYDLERGTAGALAAERPPAKTVATVQAAAPKSHE